VTIDRLDPEIIRANIQRARERRDRAMGELAAATDELNWWRAGQKMFDPEGAQESLGEEAADEIIRRLIPNGFETSEPTLRQAILLSMRAGPHTPWSVDELSAMMALNGWLPMGPTSKKRISDMATVMVNDGLLLRPDRGVYQLPEILAAALERALHPITDYRMADQMGFSVPDHPSPSGN
jgi:hypothetical protein